MTEALDHPHNARAALSQLRTIRFSPLNLLTIQGMGQDLPDELANAFISAISSNAQRNGRLMLPVPTLSDPRMRSMATRSTAQTASYEISGLALAHFDGSTVRAALLDLRAEWRLS